MSTSRRLWLQPGETEPPNQPIETHSQIFERFALRPPLVPLWHHIATSLVVGQEVIVTCLFLAGHRTITSHDLDTAAEKLQVSLLLVWIAFVLVLLHNQPTNVDQSQPRSIKIRHRTADGLLMAVLLRFLAAVLKTLTASYSTDTVYALAISGFVLHCLACDYSYANGIRRPQSPSLLRTPSASPTTTTTTATTSSSSSIVITQLPVPRDTHQRPAFEGGTLSLTAAFFATTLLASRLESNVIVYIFVSSAVVLFALYPAARHQVAVNTTSQHTWVPLLITCILAVATFRLFSSIYEIVGVSLTLGFICGIVPCWKFLLQHHKVTLVGPWVLVHPSTAEITPESH